MYSLKKICPKCGGMQFLVSPHVVQEWIVDGNGNFIVEIESCVEVVHYADDDDIWTCYECGHEAVGSEFNVK